MAASLYDHEGFVSVFARQRKGGKSEPSQMRYVFKVSDLAKDPHPSKVAFPGIINDEILAGLTTFDRPLFP